MPLGSKTKEKKKNKQKKKERKDRLDSRKNEEQQTTREIPARRSGERIYTTFKLQLGSEVGSVVVLGG